LIKKQAIDFSSSGSIKLQDAYFRYGNSILFENINFDLSYGKISCLLGVSGIGKSTLLRLFAGLVSPIPPTKIFGVTEPPAYMGQNDLLLPWLNVLQNTLLGPRLRRKKQDITRALELLKMVGLSEHVDKKPRHLSGGMRQRVAIARTLIEDSPLVLLDEPFASIDSLNRHKLQTLIAKVLSKKTVLLVTHDPLEALRLGHRIFIMEGIPAKIRELKITLGDNIPRNTSRADVLLAQADLLKSLAPDTNQ
jgi:putative hydroxymethylpyrimidine transport system ATP-binding protein